MKVLISAYSCRPNSGSEPGIGWNWVIEIAKRGHEVYVLTRTRNKRVIEDFLAHSEFPKNVHFFYFDLPGTWLALKKIMGVHLYYQLWQKAIVKTAMKLDEEVGFDMVHHITFGVFRQNTFLYQLGKPLYLGPLGGGEKMPDALLKSLPLKAKIFERLRLFSNRVSLYNPYLLKSFKAAAGIYLKTNESRNCIPRQFWDKAVVTNDIGCFNDIDLSNIKMHTQADFNILFVGRLLHWKGAHLAIRAFKLLHDLYPDTKLSIIGSGGFKENLLAIISQSNLQGVVQIVEHLPQQDVFTYFEKANVFLFPTLHDSSGSVVYEAISFGLPVVTLNLNGPGFILGNNYDTSVNVANEDNEDAVIAKLSTKLIKLYTDGDYYNSMSKLSIQKATQLTYEKIVGLVYDGIEKKFADADG